MQLRMSRYGVLAIAALSALSPPAAKGQALAGQSGAQLFQRFCVSCHGSGGEGNGPVAPFFKLQPADLTGLTRRGGGRFPEERVRRIVDGREVVLPHGARDMPVWGLELAMVAGDTPEGRRQAERSIVALVDYLKTIQKP